MPLPPRIWSLRKAPVHRRLAAAKPPPSGHSASYLPSRPLPPTQPCRLARLAEPSLCRCRKTCWKALAQHNERRRKRSATGGRDTSRTRASPKSSSCTESPGALGAGEGSPWRAGGGPGEGLAAPGGSSGAEQTRVLPGRGRRAAAAAALAHFGARTDYDDESDDETVQDGACRSAVGGKPSKLGRRSGGGGDISSGMAGQLSADFELQEVLGWHTGGAAAAQVCEWVALLWARQAGAGRCSAQEVVFRAARHLHLCGGGSSIPIWWLLALAGWLAGS